MWPITDDTIQGITKIIMIHHLESMASISDKQMDQYCGPLLKWQLGSANEKYWITLVGLKLYFSSSVAAWDDVITSGPVFSEALWWCHRSSLAASSSSALEEGERNPLQPVATSKEEEKKEKKREIKSRTAQNTHTHTNTQPMRIMYAVLTTRCHSSLSLALFPMTNNPSILRLTG